MSATVVANEGQRIDIPDGCILENRLLSGNLNMIVNLFISSCPVSLLTVISLLTGIVKRHSAFNAFSFYFHRKKKPNILSFLLPQNDTSYRQDVFTDIHFGRNRAAISD
jgi:hypothetical protein